MKLTHLISRCKKAWRSQSGIGLVEALVAIAILGMASVGFVSNLSAGSISVRTLNEAAIAQQLLTSQMETLKGAKYDVTGSSYPIINAPSGYSLTLDVNSKIYANTNLQKITATVWHNGALVEKLENYKVNR
jgi:type II secretory pathway pseudopilin PulG